MSVEPRSIIWLENYLMCPLPYPAIIKPSLYLANVYLIWLFIKLTIAFTILICKPVSKLHITLCKSKPVSSITLLLSEPVSTFTLLKNKPVFSVKLIKNKPVFTVTLL